MRTSIRVHENNIRSQHALKSNQRLYPHINVIEENQKQDSSHHMFANNRNNQQIINDRAHQVPYHYQKPSKYVDSRKQLNIVLFVIVVLAQLGYTVYSAVSFFRLNGEYEFFIMGFCLPIFYLMVSGYLLRDFTRFLPLYGLLDPLMVLTFSLIGVYIIPYVLMGRNSVPEILQLVGFGLCNLAMVGNFRVMLLEMNWDCAMVVIYKLQKLLSVLIYLAFGATYKIKQISYSLNTDPIIDNKIEFIVLLYVLSGFSLQLMIFSKISDFDRSNYLSVNYEIIQDEERQFYSRQNGQIENVFYHPNQKELQNYIVQNSNNNRSKSPHYPSYTINENHNSPPVNHSQIKIVHNLNEIRKFQRKSVRPSIDMR